MPANYARFLIGNQRTLKANRQLGWVLAFVAGSMNAGGFLAVQQYTSHVTGLVSSVADQWVLGQTGLATTAAIGVLAFLLGAVCCAMLVHFARRHRLSSEYALPLLLESVLILCFGFMGAQLLAFEGLVVPFTVLLLCFIMGLQNAVMTKLSNAVIRTTHVTGIVTDLGIELGKLAYWNRKPDAALFVRADRERLLILGGLLAAFFLGGLAGALGFKRFGYGSTVPLAVVLAIFALVPAVDDLRRSRRSL